jgi:hypothetical protein
VGDIENWRDDPLFFLEKLGQSDIYATVFLECYYIILFSCKYDESASREYHVPATRHGEKYSKNDELGTLFQ